MHRGEMKAALEELLASKSAEEISIEDVQALVPVEKRGLYEDLNMAMNAFNYAAARAFQSDCTRDRALKQFADQVIEIGNQIRKTTRKVGFA